MKIRSKLTTIGAAALAAISIASPAQSKSLETPDVAGSQQALVAGKSCGSWQQSGWLDGLNFAANGTTGDHAFHSRFRFSSERLDIAVRNGTLGLRYQSPTDTRAFRVPIRELGDGAQSQIAGLIARLSPDFKNAVNSQLFDLALSATSSSGGTVPLEIAVLNTAGDTAASAGGVSTQRAILDCASYAVCYWGCVAGGGGWLECGTKCNGGGAGQGRCY